MYYINILINRRSPNAALHTTHISSILIQLNHRTKHVISSNQLIISVRMLQDGTFTVGACLSLSDILDIFKSCCSYVAGWYVYCRR